jgi:exosortase D (VPLPA-CTERM-specific)
MPKMFEAAKPTSWAKLGLYVLALCAVYYSALGLMIAVDWPREDFNYCYLIPLIVLYLIWEKRDRLAASGSGVSWWGMLPICLGLILFWIGEFGGELFSLYISLWLVIVGLVLLHFGWEKLKAVWFAMAMMLGMFPIPNIITVRLTFGLKLISSQIGVGLLQLYGMSAFREGNVIDLGFTQLQVVEACSGLRYLMPLLILSLLLAYWNKAHIWKRIFLVLSSVPIAIFVNSFRIAATGILYSFWGASVAEGFFHGFSGWLIFMLTIPVLLVEMWVLQWIPPRRQVGDGKWIREEKATMDDERDRGEPNSESKTQRTFSFFQPVFIIPIALLAMTLVVSKTVDFREKIPIKKPLATLPMTIGGWTGKRQQLEQEFIDQLHFTDYAMIDYVNTDKRTVNFYTAYYESQKTGEATHSPETCLPGNGWIFRDAGATDIPVGSGKSMRINRAFIEKTGAKELTYYWFAQRGRVLTNLYQVKLYSFWDALTKHRTDGALVRLITPVYERENMVDAEARLQGFTKEIVPVLKEYIPE